MNTPTTAPPTWEQLRDLWMRAVPYSGPTERFDREENFWRWAVEQGATRGEATSAASAPPPLHATAIETRDNDASVVYTAHCGCGWSGQPQVAIVSDQRSRHRALDAAERMAEHHAATAKGRGQ